MHNLDLGNTPCKPDPIALTRCFRYAQLAMNAGSVLKKWLETQFTAQEICEAVFAVYDPCAGNN
jgi:hypothetical protein